MPEFCHLQDVPLALPHNLTHTLIIGCASGFNVGDQRRRPVTVGGGVFSASALTYSPHCRSLDFSA